MKEHITIRQILAADFPKPHPCTGQLLKMLFIIIWAHQNTRIRVADIARMAGCGERTAYRGLQWLDESGYIGHEARVRPGNTSTWWVVRLPRAEARCRSDDPPSPTRRGREVGEVTDSPTGLTAQGV